MELLTAPPPSMQHSSGLLCPLYSPTPSDQNYQHGARGETTAPNGTYGQDSEDTETLCKLISGTLMVDWLLVGL
ncbi:hypothetical protein XELAEV_18045851mg [Xenopus laevis]|uniref:Uncharacterized protein n=1 Tax=Xenopus laevis TaxID=8355 RepID=A0A974BS23_XENLA|nr:hypothetical protein XELAEV_18045851mg [Xenopus laevis]